MKIYPIFIPQQGCAYQCIYCNQFEITGTQEIDKEKLISELNMFKLKNKGLVKEIAFFGGTFTALDPNVRIEYFNLIEPFLDSKTTVRYSTRPDCIDTRILAESILNHVTTIELGIQSFEDNVLRLSGRNYTSKVAINAAKAIKENGIKLGVQLMPGLPGYSQESLARTISITKKIKPDFVRIYPLLVLHDTPLEQLYKKGVYNPLKLQDAVFDAVEMIDQFEEYGIKIAKVGLHSDITERDAVVAGPFHPSFGELVKGELLIRKMLKEINQDCVLEISDKNISLLYGHNQYILKQLLKRCSFTIHEIVKSMKLKKGEFRILSR